MTPDWKALGLREPRDEGTNHKAIYVWDVDRGELGMKPLTRWGGPNTVRRCLVCVYGRWEVHAARIDKSLSHKTLESAAAHLRRLGCGVKE